MGYELGELWEMGYEFGLGLELGGKGLEFTAV